MTIPEAAKLPRQISLAKGIINTILNFDNPIPMLMRNFEKFDGTYSFPIAGGSMKATHGIATIDPDIIQHILQKNHKNYTKSEVTTKALGDYIGKGLLTSDGDYWLRQRRLIQPCFHRQRLASITDLMLDVIDDYTTRIALQVQKGEPIDIYKQMLEITFRVIARSLFSTGMSEQELHYLDNVITQSQQFIIRRVRTPYLFWWLKLSGAEQKQRERSAATDAAILKFIKQRRGETGEFHDILDMMMNARYEDTGETMNDQQLMEELLILFIAGHETSANALSWAWFLLAQNPDVVAKLREELAQVLGDRSPTFDDLPKLEYTRQVIQETMRMYPPAWVLDRKSLADDEVKGVLIPANSMIVLFAYGAHNSPKYWNNPERFDPERFNKENSKQIHPFAYFPFGGGPRLCIGNNFAMMEMQMVLAQMVRKFDFELAKGQQIVMSPLVTLRPKHGVKLNMSLR